MTRSPPLVVALLLLPACAAPPDEDVVVATDNGTITLALQDPTTGADALSGVDTLRVDVELNGQVVASDSFSWPDEEGRIEGVDEYGVARFVVSGLGSGTVRSLGRSAEVVLSPAADLRVPVTFLPVNRVFGLAAEMQIPRSDHDAIPLGDGRVLLVGGNNAERSASFDELEIYDPFEGAFSIPGAYLEVGAAGTRWAWTGEGELLIIGGEHRVAGQATSTDQVYRYRPSDGSLAVAARLVKARRDHCAAQYMTNAIFVLGGADTENYADALRYYTDPGAWSSTLVTMAGDFRSDEVADCSVDTDGRVFVMGTTAASTGIWDGNSGSGLGEAFRPIGGGAGGAFVTGGIVARLEPGRFWVAGGADAGTGVVGRQGQDFLMDSASFVQGTSLSTPRQGASWDWWIDGATMVVGCGWSDVEGRNAVNRVELLDPLAGEAGPVADLDRARPGCRVTTLLDGSVLITGGYERATGQTAASAAIMVPYW